MRAVCYGECAPALRAMCVGVGVLDGLPLDGMSEWHVFVRWAGQARAVVLGSALGRDVRLLGVFEAVLDALVGKLVVCDGDAFWYIAQDPQKWRRAINNIRWLILTPNSNELKRLYRSITGKVLDYDKLQTVIDCLPKYSEDVTCTTTDELMPILGPFFKYFERKNCCLLLKGSKDVIISHTHCYIIHNKANLKRCSGQGDILSGLAALFAQNALEVNEECETGLALAAYINRCASFVAFQKHKLGTTSSDILCEIQNAVLTMTQDEIEKLDFELLD